jgi:hypothetical protein
VTYVAWLELEDGVDNPLPKLPTFREFQENIKNWLAEPPILEHLTVIGSYRLFLVRTYQYTMDTTATAALSAPSWRLTNQPRSRCGRARR